MTIHPDDYPLLKHSKSDLDPECFRLLRWAFLSPRILCSGVGGSPPNATEVRRLASNTVARWLIVLSYASRHDIRGLEHIAYFMLEPIDKIFDAKNPESTRGWGLESWRTSRVVTDIITRSWKSGENSLSPIVTAASVMGETFQNIVTFGLLGSGTTMESKWAAKCLGIKPVGFVTMGINRLSFLSEEALKLCTDRERGIILGDAKVVAVAERSHVLQDVFKATMGAEILAALSPKESD